MSFDSLGLDPALLRAVKSSGYTSPSPIQVQAIPAVLAGDDILAAAQTGTGKTAGFSLPLLQILSNSGSRKNATTPRALVLTPTRELAAQVGASLQKYGAELSPALVTQTVFGGVKINPQIARLRRGVDVLVATPGRLLDLQQQRIISLAEIEILVLDEADRMLDMGFIHDIKKVLKMLPSKRQSLLFSATFSKEIRTLAQGLLNNPVSIEVAPRNTTAERIDQKVYHAEKHDKIRLLGGLIEEGEWSQVLVFTTTKHFANRLTERLCKMGYNSAAIHGNKSQNARTKALEGFKNGEIRVLVATDVAARGIDINQLPHVVNYELPKVPEDYVHRIGRTGRAGKAGLAVSLVSREEQNLLRAVQRVIKTEIPVGTLEGFEPSEAPPRQEQAERPRGQRNTSGRNANARNSNSSGGGGKSRTARSPAKSSSGEASTDGRSRKRNTQSEASSSNRNSSNNNSSARRNNRSNSHSNPPKQSQDQQPRQSNRSGNGNGGGNTEADGNREAHVSDVNGNSVNYTASVGNRPVFETKNTGNRGAQRPRKPRPRNSGGGGGGGGGNRGNGNRSF